MDYRHLKFFVAVAEELHFTRAARRLRVAQPHLSQEIRRLERELGVELFARTKRNVELTPAGVVFLVKVRGVFEATENAIRSAQRASRGEIGRLAIGFVSTAAYSVVPEAVASFRQAHPNVEIVLTELNSNEGIELVRRGQLDLCLAYGPHVADPTLNIEVAWHERLVLAVSNSHRLARVRRIKLEMLKLEPWVIWPREISSQLHDAIFAACSSAGFEPRVAQRTMRMTTVVSLVAGGIGVALVPENSSHFGVRGVVFRPIDGARVEVPMSFVSLQQPRPPPALAPFLACARNSITRLGPTRTAKSK